MKLVIRLPLVCVMFLFSTAVMADDVLVNDPLDGSTAGDRQGGSFVEGGWTATSASSKIVYTVGEKLDCGSVEVDVRNFNPKDQFRPHKTPEECDTDIGCKIHFLAGYEGAHGSQHQAGSLGETFFFSRAYGVEASNPEKYKKIKLGTSGGSTYARTPYEWDPGVTYNFKISWTMSGATLFIKGRDECSLPFEWQAGEQDPTPNIKHFFLGTDNTAGRLWLEGPVYSNFKVLKTADCGDPCAGHCGNGGQDCGETGVDCGGACQPCQATDAGAPILDGGAVAVSRFTAVADTYANVSEPDGNFGSAADMRVGAQTDGSHTRIAFLRFDVAGLSGRLLRARVMLKAMNAGGGGGMHAVADNSWDENALTWNNKPDFEPGVLDSAGIVEVGEIVSFDVTAALRGNGARSFAIVSAVEDGSGYWTKESDQMKPYIEITEAAEPGYDAGPVEPEDAGPQHRDGSPAGDGPSPADEGKAQDAARADSGGAGKDAGAPGGDSDAGATPFKADGAGGGCSCKAYGKTLPDAGGLVFALLLLAVLRPRSGQGKY